MGLEIAFAPTVTPAGAGLTTVNGDATPGQNIAATTPVVMTNAGALHTVSLTAAAVATLAGLVVAAGAPIDGSHPNGTYYFRTDGTQLTEYIYHAEGGAWVNIV